MVKEFKNFKIDASVISHFKKFTESKTSKKEFLILLSYMIPQKKLDELK